MKLLLAEGINLDALESVLFTHTWMHKSDNSLIKAQLFDTTARFGCSSIFTRRARLHAELLRFATSPSGVGEPAIIIEEAKVIEIDPLQGIVKLEDGREFQGNVLVGADGINSAVRGAVLAKQPSTRTSTLAKPTGIATIMSTIPIECIRSDVELASLVADGVAGLSMYYGPSNLRASFFPMDSKGNVQLVGSIPETEWKEQFERENSSIIKDVHPSHAQALYKDFHPSLVKLFGASITGKHDVWRIRDIDPLDSWSFGRSVLIGDAAHAVTPRLCRFLTCASIKWPNARLVLQISVRGVTLVRCSLFVFDSCLPDPVALPTFAAVEDAEALGFLLRDVKKGDSAGIAHAFTTFETLRKSRATYIQLTSRMAGGMLTGDEAAAIGPFDPAEFSKVRLT